MDDAGIKYVVTDFRQHPLTNTTKSIELLGKIFDKEDKAEAFNKDWTDTVDRVKETAAKADKKPKTFLWRAAGWNDCCATVKKATWRAGQRGWWRQYGRSYPRLGIR